MGEHQMGGSAQTAGGGGGGAAVAFGGAINSNHQFRDTTYTKVFVGGLAWETQRDTMRRHFEQYGEILEAVVIMDKNTGRSKGYGFVTFRDPEGARRACLDATPVIDGRRANCNLASLGAHRSRPATPLHGNRMLGVMSPYSPSSHSGGPTFVGSPAYPQHLFPNYQIYGFSPYSHDYGYQQSVYNPYGVAQYPAQMYTGAVASPAVYNPYGSMQFVQPLQAAAAAGAASAGGGGGATYPFASSSPGGSSSNSSGSYGGAGAAPHNNSIMHYGASSSLGAAAAGGTAAPSASSLPLQQSLLLQASITSSATSAISAGSPPPLFAIPSPAMQQHMKAASVIAEQPSG